ncbi:hypothetical protein E2C01_024439 [Portunus trituberculatus]|uniref:Uncharacterized protein n=1 Tax=Portunus trituberculatus TaxID=210409 RepID=A0A5B7EAC9_PORTR|nr:hypothetical protein [Portunus trituberculatus]
MAPICPTSPIPPQDYPKRRCLCQLKEPEKTSGISNNFTSSSFPPLFHPDGTTAVSSVFKAELFSKTIANNSTLDDSVLVPPSPPHIDYFMSSINILRNDVFHNSSATAATSMTHFQRFHHCESTVPPFTLTLGFFHARLTLTLLPIAPPFYGKKEEGLTITLESSTPKTRKGNKGKNRRKKHVDSSREEELD